MKKILLIMAMISTYAMSGFPSGTNMSAFTKVNDDNKRLCKVFIEKAHNYEATMEDSKYAKATIGSYKERVVEYCGTLAAKS